MFTSKLVFRKHFELGAAQDLHQPLSDEGLAMNRDNMERLMGNLEELSVAIGQLSCLDRMVDRCESIAAHVYCTYNWLYLYRGGRSMDLVDREETEAEEVSSIAENMDRPLRISRRSTMSNATESTQILESDMDYVERMSQRTLV